MFKFFFSKPALLKIDVKGVRSVCLLVMIRVAIAHIHSICMYMKNVTNRLFIEDAKKCKRSKTSFEWCCWLNSGISKNELAFIFFKDYARDASCHVHILCKASKLAKKFLIFFINVLNYASIVLWRSINFLDIDIPSLKNGTI